MQAALFDRKIVEEQIFLRRMGVGSMATMADGSIEKSRAAARNDARSVYRCGDRRGGHWIGPSNRPRRRHRPDGLVGR